jgi:hypothetical protein
MIECLCKGVKGSLIEEVLWVADDDFVDPPKSGGIFEPLDEQMNNFEKAVFTVMHRLGKEIDSKIEAIKGEEITIKLAREFKVEISECRDKREMLKNLLFLSIQDRLNIWNKTLGVSQGFKIIIPDESECSHGIAIELPDPTSLMELLNKVIRKHSAEKPAEEKTE